MLDGTEVESVELDHRGGPDELACSRRLSRRAQWLLRYRYFDIRDPDLRAWPAHSGRYLGPPWEIELSSATFDPRLHTFGGSADVNHDLTQGAILNCGVGLGACLKRKVGEWQAGISSDRQGDGGDGRSYVVNGT